MPGTRRIRHLTAVAAVAAACAGIAPSAMAGKGEEPILQAATYSGMSTFSCRTDAITLMPGQNLNAFDYTQTCPNARLVSGDGDPGIFGDGAAANGFITRFKPNMIEIKKKKVWIKTKGGKRKQVIKTSYSIPAVDDLHLHHVVWLRLPLSNNDRFATGEEKTYVKLPQGYGYRVGSQDGWSLNHMLHNLTATPNRKVYLTWEIDWVPATPGRSDIEDVDGRWMDVAGLPRVYPVFDAKKAYTGVGENEYVFPDDVPGLERNSNGTLRKDCSEPGAGSGECPKISTFTNGWKIPSGGVTLIAGAGHLHPGGKWVDLEVDRDLGDDGNTPGDSIGETKRIFRSNARYYEPAGATSWDVSMEATEPEWRIKLKENDVVRVSTTYDVEKGDWIESMGIIPMAFVSGRNEPASFDPWDDATDPTFQEVTDDASGILTHGRLNENIDSRANRNLGLANPANLSNGKSVSGEDLTIESFLYSVGGYLAIKGYPKSLMRPAVIGQGESVTFVNRDALEQMTQPEQAWHSITSCAAPCNRGPGIGYPLANGPRRFDSGQLGYGDDGSGFFNEGVTTGSNRYTTPAFDNPGLYTYFCRLHPYMRGSIRVKPN